MTTRPASVRNQHHRTHKRVVLTGLAGASWLGGGALIYAFTHAWWAWAFIAVGLVAATLFFGLLPRMRRAKAQLRHVEQLRMDQEAAAQAQHAARVQAFRQPPMRSPFGSRS